MTVARKAALALTWMVATVLLAANAGSAHPPRPTSIDQPLRDGCQRSLFGVGFDTSPEWVYIYRNPALREARGIVRVAHASLQDAILTHRAFDFNGNLVTDSPYRYLIAGSRSRGTQNFAGGGEDHGRLHFEWESGTLPPFAYPTDGDRVTLWGAWIWDCGHWTSGSGTVTGEGSELHSLSVIAVDRRRPFLSSSGESQTDIFISNQGDIAHAVEKCALTHHPVSTVIYDSGFKACTLAPTNRIQPLARAYTFFVRAPRRPAPGATLRWRIANRIAHESGHESVRVAQGGIVVTVRLPATRHPIAYGKTFFVSWSLAPAHPPVAIDVTLKSILIRHADPNPAVADPSGAHWNLYLDVNGYWQLLNRWAPRLTTHVFDGERIAIRHTVRIYVPSGAGVWLQVSGRECDEPAATFVQIVHLYANLLYPCPPNRDEQNPNLVDLLNNDDPGTILDRYRSVSAALGRHVSTSSATVSFPGTGPISFGDGKQGQADYVLRYTIGRG